MLIKKDWASFKIYVIAKSSPIEMFETIDRYELYSSANGVVFHCVIFKDSGIDQLDFEATLKPVTNKPTPQQISAFAAKVLPDGKRLFKREHGIQQAVGIGTTTIIFTVPYNHCKISGVELINGTALDTLNLTVHDTTTGTYFGIPDLQLNQFGFNVNVAEGEYSEENPYDADLYLGMQIKITYITTVAKTVGVNFNLSEVKV